MKEYLSTADYKFIRDYESKVNQRVYLERLLHEFVLSSWQYPDNDDLKILAELKKTSEDILQNVAIMRNRINLQEISKTTFTLSEIRDNIRNQYRSLKEQYADAVDTKNFLMRKKVSPLTALSRAKNIFVHGGFDKLHSLQKSYEETLEQFECDNSNYLHWQQNFNNKTWTSDGDKLREQYYLIKKKIYLESTERKLEETKIQLDKELARLEKLCQTETAKEKIAFLAANLLFKNFQIAQEYESAKKLVKDLSEKLHVAEKRFNVLNDNYSSAKKNLVYRVIQPTDSTKNVPTNENGLISIIADALLGEPYTVQLVARFDGNNLEMDKDWELMSELEKDELMEKKIVRKL